jgi:hypothetical protein
MDFDDVVDAEWRELPPERSDLPAAVRARARLAQALALRDMTSSWRRHGPVISEPSPRLRPADRLERDTLWTAACGGSRSERARAAEILAVNDFLSRLRPAYTPLRSI